MSPTDDSAGLTLQQEGTLIFIVGIGGVLSGIASLNPNYQMILLPEWVPGLLILAFILLFAQWAMKGGMPPRY